MVFDYTKKRLAKYCSVLGEKPPLKEKNTTQTLWSTSFSTALPKNKPLNTNQQVLEHHITKAEAQRESKAAQFLQKISPLLNYTTQSHRPYISLQNTIFSIYSFIHNLGIIAQTEHNKIPAVKNSRERITNKDNHPQKQKEHPISLILLIDIFN